MNANRKPSESDVIDAKFALVHALAKCKGTSHSVVSHSTVTIGNEDAFECLTFRLRTKLLLPRKRGGRNARFAIARGVGSRGPVCT